MYTHKGKKLSNKPGYVFIFKLWERLEASQSALLGAVAFLRTLQHFLVPQDLHPAVLASFLPGI